MNLEPQTENTFEEVFEDDDSLMECCFTCVDGIEGEGEDAVEEGALGSQQVTPEGAGLPAVYGVVAPEENQLSEDLDEEEDEGPLADMVFDNDEAPSFAITDEDVERAFNGVIPSADSLTDEDVEAILIAAVERIEGSTQGEPSKGQLCFGGQQGDYARYAVTLAREAAREASKLKKLDPAMLEEAHRIRFINEANTTANQKETGVRFNL